MRMAIYRGTGLVQLLGTRDVVVLGPGAHVDLDQVVGERDGRLETVADQLGALVALCERVTSETEGPAAAPPSGSSPTRASKGRGAKE